MRLQLVLASCLACIAFTAPTTAATYVTDNATFTGLGSGSGASDQVTLNSVASTIAPGGTYLINTVDFTAAAGRLASGVFTGSFTDIVNLNGTTTTTYIVPYTLTIAGTQTIVIGGSTGSFAGYSAVFNALTLTSTGPGTVSGDLTATIGDLLPAAAPEPASWVLMIVGFGAVGAALRRRTLRVCFA